jgi:hypothetical protein
MFLTSGNPDQHNARLKVMDVPARGIGLGKDFVRIRAAETRIENLVLKKTPKLTPRTPK